MKAYRIRIKGIVQGVGYRYYAIRQASSLGLKGTVKNLWDGSVEVVAEGNENVLETLISLLKQGPRHAQVSKAEVEEIEYSGRFKDFRVVF
jgi:acylphosphatase